MITPKTVEVPSEIHVPRPQESEGASVATTRQEAIKEIRNSSLVPELKRIGLIFAIVAALMIVLAIIF